MSINTHELARLSGRAELWQGADTLTTAGVNPAVFVLWNPGTKGLETWAVDVRISMTVAAQVSLVWINADPGLAKVNGLQPCWLGGPGSQAFTEAAVAAAPANRGVLHQPQCVPGETDLLDIASFKLPPNTGLMVTTPVAANTFTVLWLVAEYLRSE